MARARAAGCGAAPAASAFGFMLVLICARCSAFLVASSCSGRMVLGRTRSVQHTHNLCAPQQQRGALAMANDFQENALGISIGDRVRVKQMEQRFYHIQAFKDEGLDATGFEGEVKDVSVSLYIHTYLLQVHTCVCTHRRSRLTGWMRLGFRGKSRV
eukprot:TRINITY_DN735_c0_g1_i2.p1 TRINITY_DN735_c0_g1~~TRINITY_DN735_c0_g1_i2.p1  ORF type:complete len:174 (-),score=31.16 TRINITY_DN735_c0_g1_i2:1575-2045(-)